MRIKALSFLLAAVAAVVLVSASGAATTKVQHATKIDVSTRAAVVHYLRSIHVNPKKVVIQRGLHNYAGARCPGKGWTCASTKHTVVQIARRGGQNRYACGTAKCAVVQLGSAPRGLHAAPKANAPLVNSASCVKTTGVTQSCTINQPNASGTNQAVVYMVNTKLTGLTQNANYTASITQGPASAAGSTNNNVACVQQSLGITGSTKTNAESVTVTSDAHQSATIQQNSLTGSNTVQGATANGCGSASSSLTQTETLASTVTGKGSITQLQDTAAGSPNVLLDIEQNQNTAGGFKGNANATAPNAASFVQTSNMTAIANTPKGPVTQTQSSPDDYAPFSGIVAAINQDTTGISTASATQIETQCQDAATSGLTKCDTKDQDPPTSYLVTQKQYGPEGIYHSTKAAQGRVPFVHKTPGDSAQTGNPASASNQWGVTQSSTQDNDTNSGQKNTIAGGIASPGTGTTNQNALINGSSTIDVQDGNSTISCPTGKSSCTKTLSVPKITGQPDNPSLYGSGNPFTFKNADPTVTFLCSIDGAPYGNCTSVTNPTITSPPYPPTTGTQTTAGLASGKHTFSVETVDPANPSTPGPATATITWWITPPDPTITSTAPPSPDFSGNSYTFTWTDTDNSVQYQCSIDGGTATSCSSGQSYSNLPAGSTTFTVTAYGAYDSGFTHPDTTPPTASWTVLPLTISANGSNGLTNDSAVGTDGSEAGWECEPGGPIALTVGTQPYDPITNTGAGAEIDLLDAPNTPLSTLSEPTFTTDNYGAGTPRYYIVLKNGDSLWGYPPSNGNVFGGPGFGWATNNGNTYQSWADAKAAEGNATVISASVIADASNGYSTTANIWDLQFNGNTYLTGTCPTP